MSRSTWSQLHMLSCPRWPPANFAGLTANLGEFDGNRSNCKIQTWPNFVEFVNMLRSYRTGEGYEWDFTRGHAWKCRYVHVLHKNVWRDEEPLADTLPAVTTRSHEPCCHGRKRTRDASAGACHAAASSISDPHSLDKGCCVSVKKFELCQRAVSMFELESGAQGHGEGQLLEISTTAARSLQNILSGDTWWAIW
jgi:hypothetical protein